MPVPRLTVKICPTPPIARSCTDKFEAMDYGDPSRRTLTPIPSGPYWGKLPPGCRSRYTGPFDTTGRVVYRHVSPQNLWPKGSGARHDQSSLNPPYKLPNSKSGHRYAYSRISLAERLKNIAENSQIQRQISAQNARISVRPCIVSQERTVRKKVRFLLPYPPKAKDFDIDLIERFKQLRT